MVHRWSTSFEIERTTSGGACSQDLVLSRRRRRPAQLANDVTVRVEGHVGGVSQLFGELRDRRALANPQGGEGVTQGVRRLVDAEDTRHRRPDPPVPVEPVVLAPSAAARSREDQARLGVAAADTPFEQVAAECAQQVHPCAQVAGSSVRRSARRRRSSGRSARCALARGPAVTV